MVHLQKYQKDIMDADDSTYREREPVDVQTWRLHKRYYRISLWRRNEQKQTFPSEEMGKKTTFPNVFQFSDMWTNLSL